MDLSDKSNTKEDAEAFKAWLTDKGEEDQFSLHSVTMQYELGLRLRESLAIKIREKDPTAKTLKIKKTDCPKNNRPREIKIERESQRIAIEEARRAVTENKMRSLIPNEKTLIQQKNKTQALVRKFRKETGRAFRCHGERHRFAHERYSKLWQERTGQALSCPAKHDGDWKEYARQETGLSIAEIKKIDEEVRMQVSLDLGHARISITRTYLG